MPLLSPLLQVPVKDRPGHFLMTYHCSFPPLLLTAAVAAALLLSSLLIQVPVKDRPGHFVMTYHMDVRHTEPVESVLGNSLSKQKGQEGVYSPMGDWNSNSQQQMLERAMSNGRVPANAW